MAAKKAVKKAIKKAPRQAKASRKAQPIPKGMHTVTPALVIKGAGKAIAFYAKAFGAKALSRMDGPGGVVMHAEIRIGDSVVMLGDEIPQMGARSPSTLGGTASSLMIYTRNVDQAFARAVSAGCKVVMPLENQFWGDRYGKVSDPFGHEWQLATHVEDVTPKEMARRAAALFAGPPPGK